MELALARYWWVLALRGVLAITFGVMTFFWPGLFWLVVVATFAAYALLDGILALSMALTGRGRNGHWGALLLEGLVGILVGVLALIWPGITEIVLFSLIAGWALATGVFEVIAAIALRRHIRGEWALALSGILSIVLGVALILFPLAGLVVVAWWVGAYAFATGVVLLILAFRLRSLAGRTTRPTPTAGPGWMPAQGRS